MVSSLIEESSDESTIISSQTSTLTRNQGPDNMEEHGDGTLKLGTNTDNVLKDEEEEEEDIDDEDDLVRSETTCKLDSFDTFKTYSVPYFVLYLLHAISVRIKCYMLSLIYFLFLQSVFTIQLNV